MSSAFGWDENKYAWFGAYPVSAGLAEDENRWKSYVRDSIIETSISKEVLMLTRIDKPALLENLFELGAHTPGKFFPSIKLRDNYMMRVIRLHCQIISDFLIRQVFSKALRNIPQRKSGNAPVAQNSRYIIMHCFLHYSQNISLKP